MNTVNGLNVLTFSGNQLLTNAGGTLALGDSSRTVIYLTTPYNTATSDIPFGLSNSGGAGTAWGLTNTTVYGKTGPFDVTGLPGFGNSGGALIDANGNLLGINSAIYSQTGGSVGIGFAIPVSTARTVLESIVKNGHVVRGWIGVESQEITPELADSFGLQRESGAIIAGVVRNGPADKAGMRPGDILLSVDGKPVKDTNEMLNLIAQLTPGGQSTMRVLRKSRETDLQLTVGKRPIAKK